MKFTVELPMLRELRKNQAGSTAEHSAAFLENKMGVYGKMGWLYNTPKASLEDPGTRSQQ